MSTSGRLTVALIALAAAVGLLLARPAPIVAGDEEQPRLDRAAPIPHGGTTIGQTFVALHNGLSAVEVLAVVYPDSLREARLTLRLIDAGGATVAATSFSEETLTHNAPMRLSFVPLQKSAGKRYTLFLEGAPDNGATVWAYSLDGYAGGTLLVDDAPAPGDLRFSTSYTYLWTDALRDAALGLGRLAILVLPLWLILFAPGLLLLDIALPPARAPLSKWVRLGMALGVSLALIPLAWMWVTAFGVSWSTRTLGGVYAIVGLAWVWRARLRLRTARPAASLLTGWSAHDTAMALLLLVTLAARLLAIRDLSFPPWVDSPNHFGIARLLADTGRVPADYLPLLPVDRFFYHFGFHALAASVVWLSPLSLVDSFLSLGQVLNALTPLAVYTFVATLTARRRAALTAAFLVGLVSLFPGYYLSWGRYTQLTGVLILAPALAFMWRVVAPNTPAPHSRLPWERAPTSAGGTASASPIGAENPVVRQSSRIAETAVIGLIAAGLLLTHYRLFFFFGTFTLVALAGGKRRGWKWLFGAAAIGAMLSSMWLLRLGAQALIPMLTNLQWLVAPPGHNAFPVDYFRRGLEAAWVVAALLALGWGTLRRERAVAVIAGWVVVTFALVNIGPGTWLVNNNSWVITLFLPGALALGWGVESWLASADAVTLSGSDAIRTHAMFRSAPKVAMLMLAAGVMAWAGLRGLRAQVNILNPVTVLATEADTPAIDWVEEHTPEDALILVDGRKWQDWIWVGSDGGSWLLPLTGRRTTLPPLDYANQIDLRNKVNVFNSRRKSLSLLRDTGVTHVFIGAKGGELKPEMFVGDSNFRLMYSNGQAWVFEIVQSNL